MNKRLLAILSVAVLSIGMFSTSAFAANWKVNYTPGAPSGSASPVQYVHVKSSTHNYIAKCNSLSGPRGTTVTITGNVNLSETVRFDAAGETNSFSSAASINGVDFRVAITTNSQCSGSGYINAR